MTITVRSGKDWEKAVDILFKVAKEIDEVLGVDIEQDHAVKVLRQAGLEEQADEVASMSNGEFDDFSSNHLY